MLQAWLRLHVALVTGSVLRPLVELGLSPERLTSGNNIPDLEQDIIMIEIMFISIYLIDTAVLLASIESST
jgi:hypothetical protein